MRRVVFLGMGGRFSSAPLAAILGSEFQVVGLVLPRPAGMTDDQAIRRLASPARLRRPLALAGGPDEGNAAMLAWAAGIPVLEVADLAHSAVMDTLAALAPDLLCVACFPFFLPRRVRDLAPGGAYNLHPSLLPAYRGPEPLFWVFHDGLEYAGVSVHQMTGVIDGGPLVGQAPVVLPDGIGYQAAEDRCAEAGGRLLRETLRAIVAGTAKTMPQAGGGPPAPWPEEADYLITPEWGARRAFNFARGMAERGDQVRLVVGEKRYRVIEALDFETETTELELMTWEGTRVQVRCNPGTLVVEAEEEPPEPD